MFDWLKNKWNEFINWTESLFADLVEFLTDLPKKAFEGILDALASLIEAIPVPEFIQTNGLQTAVSALPESVQYCLFQSGMAPALAVLSLGFAFRMTRKLLTLFQW
jgi:hypothetical protein